MSDLTIEERPRLCFAGPLGGRRPGYVTTQSLILSEFFGTAGYNVSATSEYRNRYLRFADTITTLVRLRHKVDVSVIDVFSGRGFVLADAASAVSRRCGHRIVLTLRGGGLPSFMRRHPSWARRVLSRASVLVSPSVYLSNAVADLGFQAKVIPNVIDLESYPYRHRERLSPKLFWMRTFHPRWNPELALRVLQLVLREFPEATLVMGGQDKGYESGVRSEARSLGIAEHVRFVGFLDRAGKIREGSAADIFLNTNRVDNMPVGVVEACAMGIPVVATNVGGIPDMLNDGETALLVPDNDCEGMVNAVKRLVKDPELAGRLSRNGRKLAAKSSWQAVRELWEEVFLELSAARQ